MRRARRYAENRGCMINDEHEGVVRREEEQTSGPLQHLAKIVQREGDVLVSEKHNTSDEGAKRMRGVGGSS